MNNLDPDGSDLHGESAMKSETIRNRKDLNIAFARMEKLWGAEPGSSDGNELENLAVLIEQYENEHYPMPTEKNDIRTNDQ